MDTVPEPVTPEQIRDLQKALGRQLAHWRKAAGMTQTALAKRTAYSRSSVANVEIGRNTTTRGFWERADRELRAQGSLVDAFDTLQELITMLRAHKAWVAEHERLLRHQAAVPPKPLPSLLITTPGCGCTVTVTRWREREVLALREALRLSLGAFAERLRVALSIIVDWEDRRQHEPPSLAMQAALDDLLKLADQDARTRFARILQVLPMRSTDHAWVPRTGRPATVTALQRSEGLQAAR
ncbi:MULTISPECIES: helix-turn-helix domain-containing protein [unclassified Micromonospora]|uniref:helix-turn-helix domain-containing protein n=1 Tax=unclassified Micromonospora TaxID=2617518 RepID=UPI000BBD4277|nr:MULTISPECIES: helix-turn-helix transcriptional regulator [unclassified Micromonospora]